MGTANRMGWGDLALYCAVLSIPARPGPAPRSSPLILACPEASGPAEVAAAWSGREESDLRKQRLLRTAYCDSKGHLHAIRQLRALHSGGLTQLLL